MEDEKLLPSRTDLTLALQMSFSAQHWEGLRAILACSDSALRQVVQRWPGIAELAVADVMRRLLCLKASLHPMLCSCFVAVVAPVTYDGGVPFCNRLKPIEHQTTNRGTSYAVQSEAALLEW